VRSITKGDEEVVDLGQRIIGRVKLAKQIGTRWKKEKDRQANQYVDEKIAAEYSARVEQLKIRRCSHASAAGACARSATVATSPPGDFVKLGEAVGIIAAQSIGEPEDAVDDADVTSAARPARHLSTDH